MTFTLPPDALAQHIAVLGKTGSGKTFAMKGALVEPLLEGGRRVGIVDPTGAWWGLRSSRDGKGPGFPLFSPDSTKLYVMNSGEGDVAVIDVATQKVIARHKVGVNPFGGAVKNTGG